jgi:hypothetical protein
MFPGKLEVLERSKSKWPYWVLYHFKNTDRHSYPDEDIAHVYLKFDLFKNKIPVVIERQWAQNTRGNGRKYKTQYGILYKFLKEEDRLIFLMSQETGQ